MAQVDSGGGGKLVEYRLHLAPDVVAKLKRKALDRSEREGRTIYWSGLVRESLTKLVNEGGSLMSGVNDGGFAAALDAARYFGCEAPTEDEYRRIRAERDATAEARADETNIPAEVVTLEDGGKKLTLDARVFAELYLAAEARTWNGVLLKSRLDLMVTEATERGLAAVAAELAEFGPAVRIAAMVRRSDGEIWRPQVTAPRTLKQEISTAAPREDNQTLADEVASYLDAAAAEADDAPPVHAGWTVGRRRLRPLVRVDVDGLAALEDDRDAS